jgi:hypothetical protein
MRVPFFAFNTALIIYVKLAQHLYLGGATRQFVFYAKHQHFEKLTQLLFGQSIKCNHKRVAVSISKGHVNFTICDIWKAKRARLM